METNNSVSDNSIYGVLLQQWKKKNNIFDNLYYNLTKEDIRELLNPSNYPEYANERATRNAVIIGFYCLIVLVSLFGNLLVCYVIFKNKNMKTKTNILMVNLTLSDLIMTVVNIPFNIARLLLDEWPFGSILCMLVPLVQVTSVYVSTFSMTVIAIDRYQAIINPLHRRLSTSMPILIIIFFIWTTAIAFSIPNVAFNQVVEILGHKTLFRCQALYPSPQRVYRQIITMFTFLTQYVLPLSITAFAYIRISFNMWLKQGVESNQQEARQKSRRRSIKMLAIVVVVFSISWLPLNVFHILSDFSDGNIVYNTNLFFICHWFAMSSVNVAIFQVCYNPFIYFWLNKHYRQGIKSIVHCIRLKLSSLLELSSSDSTPRGRYIHHRSNTLRMTTINSTPKVQSNKENNVSTNSISMENFSRIVGESDI